MSGGQSQSDADAVQCRHGGVFRSGTPDIIREAGLPYPGENRIAAGRIISRRVSLTGAVP
jgi:hypothetical protein